MEERAQAGANEPRSRKDEEGADEQVDKRHDPGRFIIRGAVELVAVEGWGVAAMGETAEGSVEQDARCEGNGGLAERRHRRRVV